RLRRVRLLRPELLRPVGPARALGAVSPDRLQPVRAARLGRAVGIRVAALRLVPRVPVVPVIVIAAGPTAPTRRLGVAFIVETAGVGLVVDRRDGRPTAARVRTIAGRRALGLLGGAFIRVGGIAASTGQRRWPVDGLA